MTSLMTSSFSVFIGKTFETKWYNQNQLLISFHGTKSYVFKYGAP